MWIRAPTKGFTLSRHLPHFRSAKFTVIAIGSALCVIAAASATAATWPSASAARSQAAVHEADGLATAISQTVRTAGAADSQAANTVAAQRARLRLGAQVVAIEVAAARAAAARAQALAAREHAAHVAHQEHLTLQAAAQQRAAQQQAAQQQAAQQQAAQQAGQQQASQQQSQPPVTVASGSPQQIAEGMLAQFGWSGQFSCLDALWNEESGWNPIAENPNSGAYGIPQALPGSKMASAGPDWQTDPATQIRWGLEYIQATYGSPCAAWSHEQATGWY